MEFRQLVIVSAKGPHHQMGLQCTANVGQYFIHPAFQSFAGLLNFEIAQVTLGNGESIGCLDSPWSRNIGKNPELGLWWAEATQIITYHSRNLGPRHPWTSWSLEFLVPCHWKQVVHLWVKTFLLTVYIYKTYYISFNFIHVSENVNLCCIWRRRWKQSTHAHTHTHTVSLSLLLQHHQRSLTGCVRVRYKLKFQCQLGSEFHDIFQHVSTMNEQCDCNTQPSNMVFLLKNPRSKLDHFTHPLYWSLLGMCKWCILV